MTTAVRTRRPPPPFRLVEVARVVDRSPYLRHITLAGPELIGLEPGLPGASVRLLLPAADADDVELPTWTGNEFLAADGSRPAIRTLTPLPAAEGELDVEVVVHGEGPLSRWAEHVEPGRRAAVAGTGRGYDADPTATRFLVAGDESALPAIGVVVPALPSGARVEVIVEVRSHDARVELPGPPTQWCLTDGEPGRALVDAVRAMQPPAETHVWAAGEAAAMQRLRRYLFDERGVPRAHVVVRGYWQRGRAGEDAAS